MGLVKLNIQTTIIIEGWVPDIHCFHVNDSFKWISRSKPGSKFHRPESEDIAYAIRDVRAYLPLQFSHHEAIQNTPMATLPIVLIITSVYLRSFHYQYSFFQSLKSQQNHCLLTWPPPQLLFFSPYYMTNLIYCLVGYTSIVLTTR